MFVNFPMMIAGSPAGIIPANQSFLLGSSLVFAATFLQFSEIKRKPTNSDIPVNSWENISKVLFNLTCRPIAC